MSNDLMEIIRKVGDKWYVYSHAGKKLGGPYDSLEAAKKRLKQIEYFKHRESIDSVSLLALGFLEDEVQ